MAVKMEYQTPLRPELRIIEGNADYKEYRETIERINDLLLCSGLEEEFIARCLREANELYQRTLDQEKQEKKKKGKKSRGKKNRSMSQKQIQHVIKQAIHALRCTLMRMYLGESYRGMARRLAESPLLQWFCHIDQIDKVKVPAKSTLQRYEQMLPEEFVISLIDQLNCMAALPRQGSWHPLGLQEPIDLDTFLVDTACVEANIHFPVDWVLLRDAARTLLQAIKLIRKYGLKHRMPDPDDFLRKINRLCIEMTLTRRRSDSQKRRKLVLRRMKKLEGVIRDHALRYHDLLKERWNETELTPKQTEQILGRMKNVLEQITEAIRQAHERIIGGRSVPNEDKILSLYEPDIHVIVRGKASAPVEFGNKLLLCEQRQGLIVDFHLFKKQAPSDKDLVPRVVNRLHENFLGFLPGRFRVAMVGDRGFDDKDVQKLMEDIEWFNGIAARDPKRLEEQRLDPRFVQLQTRRAQTEARVGIIRNGFLGKPMRSKGFVSRSNNVAWAVLAHNLWVLARLPRIAVKKKSLAMAA
jgi:IS5 family transposase